MARKNEYGRYILSAGEVGSYTVCPEAWYLKVVKEVEPIYAKSVERGNELHKEWSEDFDEAMYFTRSIRFILTLTAVAVLFFLIRFTA